MNEGFYKNEDGDVLFAPNFVEAPDFEIYKENKDTYEYPVHGWIWFDSEDDAYASFGLEKPIIQTDEN